MTEYNCIIIRWGELALKGKNRFMFENALLKDCINSIHYEINDKVVEKNIIRKYFWKTRSKLYLFIDDLYSIEQIKKKYTPKELLEKIINILKNVYGISSLSPAIKTKAGIDEIKLAIDKILINKEYESFRISCKRSTKDFLLNSDEANMIFGEYVFEKYKKKVSLKKFDLNIQIEIDKLAYVLTDKIICNGGLPSGVNGTVNITVFPEDLDTLYCNDVEKMTNKIMQCVRKLSKRGCQIYIIINDSSTISNIIKKSVDEKLSDEYLASKVKSIVLNVFDALKDYNYVALYYDLNEIIEKKGKYFEIKKKIKSNLTLFPLV